MSDQPNLSPEAIAKLARLARLHIPAQQLPQWQGQFGNIMQLIDELKAAPTAGIEPLAHPLAAMREVAAPMRCDAVTEPDALEYRQAKMQNAPAQAEGLFLVPRVIE